MIIFCMTIFWMTIQLHANNYKIYESMKKELKVGMRVYMDNGCEVELVEKIGVTLQPIGCFRAGLYTKWKCRNVNKKDGGTFYCFEDELDQNII